MYKSWQLQVHILVYDIRFCVLRLLIKVLLSSSGEVKSRRKGYDYDIAIRCSHLVETLKQYVLRFSPQIEKSCNQIDIGKCLCIVTVLIIELGKTDLIACNLFVHSPHINFIEIIMVTSLFEQSLMVCRSWEYS